MVNPQFPNIKFAMEFIFDRWHKFDISTIFTEIKSLSWFLQLINQEYQTWFLFKLHITSITFMLQYVSLQQKRVFKYIYIDIIEGVETRGRDSLPIYI